MKNQFSILFVILFSVSICEVRAQDVSHWQTSDQHGNTYQEMSPENNHKNISVDQSGISWFNNGPYGGYVNCVSVSESDPDIIYIGTNHGIYKSEDKGTSWIKTGFRDYEVKSIKVSPASSDIVFAGTYGQGLWRTNNGGIDWVFTRLSDNTINCITIDPNDSNTIYFGSGEWMRYYANEIIGVFRSTDGGQTFNAVIKYTTSDYVYQINDIFIDPDNSDHIYIARAASSSRGAFLYSIDGGANWINKRMTTSSSEGIIHIAVAKDPTGEKVVYVMDGMPPWPEPKFYKTMDLGNTWESVFCPYTSKYDPEVFAINPNDPNEIYTGMRSFDTKILKYKTDQDQWGIIGGSGLGSSWSTCIDISVETNPTIYLGSYYGGMYQYTTGSSSRWSRSVRGIRAMYINDIAVQTSSGDVAYVCARNEYGLFKTNDSGVNWSWITSGAPDLLAVHPQNPLILYAATGYQDGNNYHIYKSINGGLSWQAIKFAECSGGDCYTVVTDILIHPTNPENILVATDYQWLSSGPRGFGTIARTIDGGSSWVQLVAAPSSALTLDPNNMNTVYSGKRRAGQIWKIENAWGVRHVTEITPSQGIDNITDIELDNSSNVYVSTVSGLWRYTGGDWSELTISSTNITSLGIDRSIMPNIIYSGTGDNGVFISNDGGTTWNVWNDGLQNQSITKLRIGESKVWVGTEYGGVWSRNIAQSVSPAYIMHNTGNFKLSIFQDGSFGHLSSLNTLGEGCQYRNNVDALYAGSLIFGTQSAGFVNGNQASFGIIHDFTNTEQIHEITSMDPNVDHISQTVYTDAGAVIPYGVSVRQKVFSNNGDEFVILQFSFTSSFSAEDFYAGIFADWDVGAGDGYARNLGGYDQSRNLVYQYIDNGIPDPSYYGIVALSGMSGARITTEGGMRGTTLHRITEFQDETISEPGDYRMWIGSGPITLKQSVDHSVYFAFVAGTDLVNLQANADASVQKYQHIITHVNDEDVFPITFALYQNYPNPFNPTTVIGYRLPVREHVVMKVYDILGREIVILIDEYKPAGENKVEFHAAEFPSGVYIYRLQAGNFVESKKLLLIK